MFFFIFYFFVLSTRNIILKFFSCSRWGFRGTNHRWRFFLSLQPFVIWLFFVLSINRYLFENMAFFCPFLLAFFLFPFTFFQTPRIIVDFFIIIEGVRKPAPLSFLPHLPCSIKLSPKKQCRRIGKGNDRLKIRKKRRAILKKWLSVLPFVTLSLKNV